MTLKPGVNAAIMSNIISYSQNILYSLNNGVSTNKTVATSLASNVPSTSNGYSVFNGTSNFYAFNNASGAFNITPPYSIDLELYFTNVGQVSNQWAVNIGPAYDNGRPSLSIKTNLPSSGTINRDNCALVLQTWPTASSDTGLTTNNFILNSGGLTPLTYNTTYRIGVMIYNNGANRMRGYLNNTQVFDVVAPTFRSLNVAAAGLTVGGSYPTYSYTYFGGGIRNLRIGRALFWPI